MTKKLLALFLFIVLSLSVIGFNMPHPVFGHITNDGFAVKNVEIKVHNLVTDVSGNSFTDAEGFFQVDLGNIDDRYRTGDTVKVSLVFCESNAECSKTVVLSGGGTEVNFDIAKETSQPLPSGSNEVKYQCADGSFVSSESECPSAPQPQHTCWNGEVVSDSSECPPHREVVVETFVCADGSEVDDKSKCPEEQDSWWKWVIGLLAALFLAITGKTGWKFYNGKFQHYHKGISGYHDPNTSHNNPKYRHTRWKDSPRQCMLDCKKIDDGVDLSKEKRE